MTDIVQNLGQSYPLPATLTTLFACVTPNLSAVVSNIACCNQGPAPAKFRISLQVNGANDSPQQYLFYDVVLQPNETRTVVIGITMRVGDQLMCQADTGTVSFNASGVQQQ